MNVLAVNFRRQDVLEKAMVEPFTCYADAFPKAKYYWNLEDGNFSTIVGPTLTFRHGIRRYQVRIIVFANFASYIVQTLVNQMCWWRNNKVFFGDYLFKKVFLVNTFSNTVVFIQECI